MLRSALLDQLTDLILVGDCPHPRRVAIDGIDAAGKTHLADELVPRLAARGCQAIRASLDGFHRPRAERYRRGPYSPEGYYLDSFDFPLVCQQLLVPLGPVGDPDGRGRFF
jgi:uridine kinase